MTTHSSILAGKSHGQRSLEDYSTRGHERVRYDLVTQQQQNITIYLAVFGYFCPVLGYCELCCFEHVLLHVF